MATIVKIQLVLLSLAMVQRQADSTLDACLTLMQTTCSKSEAPCLLRGEPLTQRDDYTYVPGIGAYKLHTRALPWVEARLVCEEEGAHLAIINSVAESNAIALIYQSSSAVVTPYDKNYVGIGFHDLYRAGEYVTIHGESISKAGFDQWEIGQPNNYLERQACGSVNRNGLLNDISCTRPNGFICELPIGQTQASSFSSIGANSTADLNVFQNSSQLAGPLFPGVKRNHYTYIAGIGAYKFHAQSANWNTARLICREEGAHLAIINSRAESEAIAGIFAKAGPHLDSYNSENAWLGFHDIFGGQGRYETINGEYLEDVGFNEWKEGKRGNFGQFCGSVYKNGKLDYFSCERLLAFVCELPYIQPNMERVINAAISPA